MSPHSRWKSRGRFLNRVAARRSVRFFSPEKAPFELIENTIRCALAPRGANQQPWRFVVVQDPEIEHKIHKAAEAEECQTTNTRCLRTGSKRWRPWARTGTKEFLENVFVSDRRVRVDCGLTQAVLESAGIATVFLLAPRT
jgi:nitroreductase